MFLSRLDEMNGGRGNLRLVPGSLWRILNFLRMEFLTARFCGWQMRVNGILLLSSLCDICSGVS